MKADIIGATGATGKALLAQLLDHPQFDEINIFVRRTPGITHDKLRVHIIDFSQPDTWADKLRGDVLFSCLGTTRKDAGSDARLRKIDYQAVLDAARAARSNGTPTLVLISAVGANLQSRLFYFRLKGEVERDTAALGFAQLAVFRPPMLLRPGSDRPSEVWFARMLSALNRIGILKNQRPMPVAALARAMIVATQQPANGTVIFEAADIWRLAEAGG